jgi:hypothetical protein
MNPVKDRTGRVLGTMLFGLYPTTVERGHQRWMFRCDCGNLVECEGAAVGPGRGRRKSCGCKQLEVRQKFQYIERVPLDLFGFESGRLTAVALVGKDKWNNNTWYCVCRCGGEKVIAAYFLRLHRSNSCGCLQAEVRVQNAYRLGEWRREHSRAYVNPLWSLFNKPCIHARKAKKVKGYAG